MDIAALHVGAIQATSTIKCACSASKTSIKQSEKHFIKEKLEDACIK